MCVMPCCNSVLYNYNPKRYIPPESLPCLLVRYFLAWIDINLKPGIVQESLDQVSANMKMSLWLKYRKKLLLDSLLPRTEFWETPFTFQQLIDRRFGVARLDPVNKCSNKAKSVLDLLSDRWVQKILSCFQNFIRALYARYSSTALQFGVCTLKTDSNTLEKVQHRVSKCAHGNIGQDMP